MINILILSCGTRSLLVDYFKHSNGGFDKVVTTDCSVNSPALYRTDKHYIVPRITEPSYLPSLFEICKNESINVILPLQEDELVLISNYRDAFIEKNILPVISSLDLIEMCRDKYVFYENMVRRNIPTIPTFHINEKRILLEKFGTPIFMKPRYGAGSVSSYLIKNETLIDSINDNEEIEFVLQPYLDGVEFGVNAYVDIISGELTGLFILQKLRMRAGETEKSESIHDAEIKRIIEKICSEFSFVGPIDIDIIKKDGKYYVLEINPRFGGAYPHTHECGINFVKLIANNAEGKENIPFEMDYEDGIVAFRYMAITTMRRMEMMENE